MDKRYLLDVADDADELAAIRAYAERRQRGERPRSHEALDDVADRLLDYGDPEASALLDEFEARVGRGKERAR